MFFPGLPMSTEMRAVYFNDEPQRWRDIVVSGSVVGNRRRRRASATTFRTTLRNTASNYLPGMYPRCLYDNVAIRRTTGEKKPSGQSTWYDGSSDDDQGSRARIEPTASARYVMICEFCDKEGPRPVLTQPRMVDADRWAMKLLSTQFNEDDVLISSDGQTGEYAISVYGTLFDPRSRGSVRCFCIGVVDNSLLLASSNTARQRTLNYAQAYKSTISCRNRAMFFGPSESSAPSKSNEKRMPRSVSTSFLSSSAFRRRPRRRYSSTVASRSGPAWKSLESLDVETYVGTPWTFGELTAMKDDSSQSFLNKCIIEPTSKQSRENRGLSSVCKEFPGFVATSIYVALVGLPVVIVGSNATNPVIEFISSLHASPEPSNISNGILSDEHLRSKKIIFVQNFINIPRGLKNMVCVLDARCGVFTAPKYTGRLERDVAVAGKTWARSGSGSTTCIDSGHHNDSGCDYFLQAKIQDLLQWTSVRGKIPAGFSKQDMEIMQVEREVRRGGLALVSGELQDIRNPTTVHCPGNSYLRKLLSSPTNEAEHLPA